jgi:hypothetical protein
VFGILVRLKIAALTLALSQRERELIEVFV